jgi:hypothetical protein
MYFIYITRVVLLWSLYSCISIHFVKIIINTGSVFGSGLWVMYIWRKARIKITRSSEVVITNILWEGGRVTHWDCGPVIALAHPMVVILVDSNQIHCTLRWERWGLKTQTVLSRERMLVKSHCLACVCLMFFWNIRTPPFLECLGNHLAADRDRVHLQACWNHLYGWHAYKNSSESVLSVLWSSSSEWGGQISVLCNAEESTEEWLQYYDQLWDNKWTENWSQEHKWLQTVEQ